MAVSKYSGQHFKGEENAEDDSGSGLSAFAGTSGRACTITMDRVRQTRVRRHQGATGRAAPGRRTAGRPAHDNLAVGVVYRGPTTDKPGDPTTGTYHDQVAEIYIVLSGSGILTTGGSKDKKPRPEYLLPTGPGGSGTVSPGAYSRKVQTGDIVLIPPGVLHAWSKITDHVTYLSMRPDPERALPGGYVNPLLMSNPPAPAP